MSSFPSATDLLRQYMAAIEHSDIDSVAALFSEDVVLNVPCMPEPSPKTTLGRAKIIPMMNWAFAKVFKKFSWSSLEVHATDDLNLAFAIAKSEVELYDGQHYSNDYVIYVRIRDGRIIEHTEFFDTGRAAKAFASSV